MKPKSTPRQRAEKRLLAMKAERSSWEAHWRDLAAYIVPSRVRLDASDRNDGKKRSQKIINSTPRRGHRTLAAGMMSGITSPSRPWFQLIAPQARVKSAAVDAWLHDVVEVISLGFSRSNTYAVLHGVYEDLGGLGTSAFLLEEDEEDGMRAYPQVVGRYAIANNARNRVDAFAREFSMTVAQLVERFGLEKCSPHVRRLYEDEQLEKWIPVGHIIEKNPRHIPDTLGPTQWPYTSVYFEMGAPCQGHPELLHEGGYSRFPVVAPRWSTTGEDVYGTCPGMDSLGDCKALQTLELEKAKGIKKLMTPPMVGPQELLGQNIDLLPGGTTYVEARTGGQSFVPAHELNPNAIAVTAAEIREHEGRIMADFYADLWQSVTLAEGGKMTAREVAERHEEKLMQLGPVLEKLQDELLDPLVSNAFAIALERGDIPPPPEELQGLELRVEYVSILAQAQKMIGTQGIERLAGFVGNIAAVDETILDVFDNEEAAREYAKALGTPPKLMRAPEEVARRRQERVDAQAQQAQAEQAAQLAQGAKTLSETDVGGTSALQAMLAGVGAPTRGMGVA